MAGPLGLVEGPEGRVVGPFGLVAGPLGLVEGPEGRAECPDEGLVAGCVEGLLESAVTAGFLEVLLPLD